MKSTSTKEVLFLLERDGAPLRKSFFNSLNIHCIFVRLFGRRTQCVSLFYENIGNISQYLEHRLPYHDRVTGG